MFYWILISSHPTLHHNRHERDNEAYGTGGKEYPWRESDAVAELREPVAHNIPYHGYGYHEGYRHIGEKRADESVAHLRTRGAKHLAHGYLLLTLLDEIGGHGDETQHRHEQRHCSKRETMCDRRIASV